MRLCLALFVAALATTPAFAAAADSAPLDPTALATLELKAQRAAMRDQAFLYSDLLHRVGELASHQLNSGSSDQAAASLLRVEQLAVVIDSGLHSDTRKLKEAEILMRETVVRLQDALHQASIDDQPAVKHTLQCVDQLESKMMSEVFQR